jgi:hypothetical protein
MITLTELDHRLALANERKAEISAGMPDSTSCLWNEYSMRLENAQSAMKSIMESDSVASEASLLHQSMPDLMSCCFNLNRCDAIYELISVNPPTHSLAGNAITTEVLGLRQDRVLLRYLISRLSRFRSFLLHYDDYYKMPALFQTLKVIMAGRIVSRVGHNKFFRMLRR